MAEDAGLQHQRHTDGLLQHSVSGARENRVTWQHSWFKPDSGEWRFHYILNADV